MAEVIVSTPDLTVLGGPASIRVDTSIGAAGPRGTFVMYGLLDPNNPSASFIETPAIFDLYIRTDPSSPDYLQVYQYVIEENEPQWIPTIKLTPNFYGTNRVVTFIDGAAELNINLFELGLVELRTELVDFTNSRFLFSVQATLSNYNVASEFDPETPGTHLPAMVSVQVEDIEEDPSSDELNIPITLHGAEFNGTAVQKINNKNVIVNLSILVVDPSDVTNAIAILAAGA
jgi:hypothetical protein